MNRKTFFLIKNMVNHSILYPEKAVAPHSSTLAWKIPWTEEPGRLQSMGSLGVGHDWATSLSLFTLMHWRRKWQPTPVFLPGESQGRGSLVVPSMGLHRVRHDWSDLAAATASYTQRRQWHPTPVLLLGKSHGRRSLVGCSPWGRWESDTTERLHFHFSLACIGKGSGNPLHSVLAWRIPGTVDPGGLPSTGLHRVGHDWSDAAAASYTSSLIN